MANTARRQQPNSGKWYRECRKCGLLRARLRAMGYTGNELSQRLDELVLGKPAVLAELYEPLTWVPA